MRNETITCDFCDKEVHWQKVREVTVSIKDRGYPASTLKYDLCTPCYIDGPTFRHTFKKIWAKVTGRPVPASADRDLTKGDKS